MLAATLTAARPPVCFHLYRQKHRTSRTGSGPRSRFPPFLSFGWQARARAARALNAAHTFFRPIPQSDGPGAWEVTTFQDDGATPRRVLTYPIGKFEEPFEGHSCLFAAGSDKGGTALRESEWVKEGGLWSHVTTTLTPVGKEETKRTLTPGDWNVMEVKRTFWPVGTELLPELCPLCAYFLKLLTYTD